MVYRCSGQGCRWFAKASEEGLTESKALSRWQYHRIQCHPKSEKDLEMVKDSASNSQEEKGTRPKEKDS